MIASREKGESRFRRLAREELALAETLFWRTSMKIFNAIIGATALAAVSLYSVSAAAQTYPERTVTMVVPFSAGGPTDTVARLVAEAMSNDLGQQVLVENVGGAGGTLGAGRVANAAADGYTILLHHIGMATSDTLDRKSVV